VLEEALFSVNAQKTWSRSRQASTRRTGAEVPRTILLPVVLMDSLVVDGYGVERKLERRKGMGLATVE